MLLDKEGITDEPSLKKTRSVTSDDIKRATDELNHLKKFLSDNPNAPEEMMKARFEKAYPDSWVARSMHEGDSFGEIALFDKGDG